MGNIPADVTATALFSIHPMRVELVCWVTGTKDLLAAFLLLCSLLFYCRWRSGRTALPYLASLVFFFLAGLAKATSVIAMFFFCLIDYVEGESSWRKVKLYLPYIIIAVSLGIVAVYARASYQGVLLEDYSGLPLLLLEGLWCLIVYYTIRQVVPVGAFISPYFGDSSGRMLASLILFIGSLLVAVAIYVILHFSRNRRAVIFGLLFFAIGLSPGLGVPVLGYSADRFAYVPSIGIAFLLAVLVRHLLYAGERWRSIGTIGLFILLLVLVANVTHGRCGVWRDSAGVWTDAVNSYPECPGFLANRAIALAMRGQAYMQPGQYEDAKRDFEESIRIAPGMSRTYQSRAMLYLELGELRLSLLDLEKTLQLEPYNLGAMITRGRLYRMTGDFRRSVEDFDMVLALDSRNVEALGERALTYRRFGHLERSLADLDRAVQLQPGNWVLHFNRAMVRVDAENNQGAFYDLLESIRLNPGAYEPHYQLGVLYRKMGNPELAVSEFSAAIMANPEFAEAYVQRGLVYESLGRLGQAREDARNAAALGKPDLQRELLLRNARTP